FGKNLDKLAIDDVGIVAGFALRSVRRRTEHHAIGAAGTGMEKLDPRAHSLWRPPSRNRLRVEQGPKNRARRRQDDAGCLVSRGQGHSRPPIVPWMFRARA